MVVWFLTIKDVAHRIGSKEDTHLKITQLGAENAWECAGQEHLDDHKTSVNYAKDWLDQLFLFPCDQ